MERMVVEGVVVVELDLPEDLGRLEQIRLVMNQFRMIVKVLDWVEQAVKDMTFHLVVMNGEVLEVVEEDMEVMAVLHLVAIEEVEVVEEDMVETVDMGIAGFMVEVVEAEDMAMALMHHGEVEDIIVAQIQMVVEELEYGMELKW